MGARQPAMAIGRIVLFSLYWPLAYGQQASSDGDSAGSSRLAVPPVAAANSGVAEVGEIIVTARKRSESLQSVPVSVTAVDSSTIERMNIVKIDQVGALTPNVIFKPADPGLPILSAYIRGIGERGGEPSQDHPIAISLDGVYLSGISGSLFDIFDVQQIEVLRGPQGTLQGRNSPGGAINATTQRPSGDFAGRTEISYGRFGELHVRGMLESPVVPGVLAVRLSAFDNSGGDYLSSTTTGDRIAGGREEWGTRLGFLFTPGNEITAYLTVDYSRDTSPPAPLRAVPVGVAEGPFQPVPLVCSAYKFCNPIGEYQTAAEYNAHNDITNFGTTLNVDANLGAATLTSVTGYRDVNEVLNIDIDALPIEMLEYRNRSNKSDSISEELRLASNGQGSLNYVVGGIGSIYRFNLYQPVLLGTALTGLPEPIIGTNARSQTTDSYALFGQATYKLTPEWSVTAGLRGTHDYKKAFSEPSVPGPSGEFTASFNNVSAEAGAEYHFDADKLGYFRFSQGYRAGGLNTSASTLSAVNQYEPEKVNAYELGLKTEWLDRRLTANLSAFFYDYRDFQVLEVQPFEGGFTTRIGSANGLLIKGLEIETRMRPVESLTLVGSMGFLDAKYKSQILDLGFGPFNIDTFRKDNAPRWTGYLSAEYVLPVPNNRGSLLISGDASYKSTTLTVPVDSPLGVQAGYAVLGSVITYRTPDSKCSLSIYGQNLTNRYYKQYGEQINGLVAYDVVGMPRTYGGRIAIKF